jgi:beta-glucanase (GH16 family)
MRARAILPLIAIAALAAPAHARRHHNQWQHHVQELAYQNLATLLAADPAIMAAISASNPALAAVIMNLAQLEAPNAPTPPSVAALSPQPTAAAPQTPPPIVTIPPTATTPAVSFNAPGPGLSISNPTVVTSKSPTTYQPFSSAQPTIPQAPAPAPPPGPGELAPFAQDGCAGETFFDNFQRIDPTKWFFGGRGNLSDGNNGMASYQAPVQNQTETTGPDGLHLSVLPIPGANGAHWTGGLMSTDLPQTYGYIEATVNLPPSMEQDGFGWAFWLLGQGGLVPGSQQSWTSEIDTAEMNKNVFDSAMHSGFTSDNAAHMDYSFPAGRHVFAVDWEPNTITWYIDGQQTKQAATPQDFHVPMSIVLGASAMTAPTDPNASATVTIEDVRAFNSMASALACVPNVAPSTAQVANLTPQTSLDVINTTAFKTNSPLTMGGTQ